MGLSHGPHFDRANSEIGRASLVRDFLHRQGRDLLGGLAVAIMVFSAALSMGTS